MRAFPAFPLLGWPRWPTSEDLLVGHQQANTWTLVDNGVECLLSYGTPSPKHQANG